MVPEMVTMAISFMRPCVHPRSLPRTGSHRHACMLCTRTSNMARHLVDITCLPIFSTRRQYGQPSRSGWQARRPTPSMPLPSASRAIWHWNSKITAHLTGMLPKVRSAEVRRCPSSRQFGPGVLGRTAKRVERQQLSGCYRANGDPIGWEQAL